MKTIGLIGGISWESTKEYYELLNREVNRRLGGSHSARIRMYSFDFQEIIEFNDGEDFDAIGKRLVVEAGKLEEAGADLLVLGANTAHRWADRVQETLRIPIIHIADATGRAIQAAGIRSTLLLGTIYTMEGTYISGKLEEQYGLNVVIPNPDDRRKINRIIFDELVRGRFTDEARQFLLEVIDRHTGVEGVILGCTELPLIIRETDRDLPMFNTTYLHAMAVVDAALS